MEQLVFLLFVLRSFSDSLLELIRFEGGGLDLTAGAFLNIGILGVAVLMIFLRPGSSFPFKVWLPFLFVSSLSVIWSPDKAAAIRLLVVLFTSGAAFIIPFFMRRDFQREAPLLKAIIYSSFLPAAFGVFEYIFFLDANGRVKSTFSHPNVFAFYLVIVFGLVVFLLASSAVRFGPISRKIMVPYSGFLLGLIVLTQTRSAWFGVLLIFTTYAIFADRRYLFGLLLLPALLFVPAVSERLSDLSRGGTYTGQMKSADDTLNSFAWRQLMWESAMEDVSDAPILGKGLASFAPNSLTFFPLADPNMVFSRGSGIGAHNVFVQVMYETGLLGLMSYVSMYLFLLIRAINNLRRDPRGTVVLVSIIGAYAAASYSDNMLSYGAVNLYFWGVTGIVFSKWQQETLEARRARYSETSHLASI